MSVIKAKTFKEQYVVADPNGETTTWKPDDFWKMAFDNDHPKNNSQMGYLISEFSFDTDWDSWEMHPHGDEVVFCKSGFLTFILELENQQKVIDLKPGEYLIVPQNTWHTAKVSKPTSAVFITWGFGTQNRKTEEQSE